MRMKPKFKEKMNTRNKRREKGKERKNYKN